MEDFYVDLVSNASMNVFSTNTASAFTNKLATSIELSTNNWEAGLVEIVYPKVENTPVHKGSIALKGDVLDNMRKNFKIDFSKNDPFAELKTKVAEIKSSLEGAKKPDLTQDNHGVFEIKSGKVRVPTRYKASAETWLQTNAAYFALDPEGFKNHHSDFIDKLTKTKDDFIYKDNVAPTANKARKEIPIYVRTSEVKSSTQNIVPIPGVTTTTNGNTLLLDYTGKVVLEASDNLEKRVELLNAAIAKIYATNLIPENKFPKPKFTRDKNYVIYEPGLIRTSEEIAVTFELDPQTVSYLGFTKAQKLDKTNERASRLPTMSVPHLMYVYCDLIREHHVGDVMAESLRGMMLKTNDAINYQTFNPILYFPVRRKKIDEIAISIKDDTGHNVKFESARTHLTLHFRESI